MEWLQLFTTSRSQSSTSTASARIDHVSAALVWLKKNCESYKDAIINMELLQQWLTTYGNKSADLEFLASVTHILPADDVGDLKSYENDIED